MAKSIVQYFGLQEDGHCGYCKSPDLEKFSYGIWTHALNVFDYQILIDRGWRRSGKYCYKPVMHKTCCPQYTIRCHVSEFQLSKSQKRILKRFSGFLICDSKPSYAIQKAAAKCERNDAALKTPSAVSKQLISIDHCSMFQPVHSSDTSSNENNRSIKTTSDWSSNLTDKLHFNCKSTKAKFVRREKKRQKLLANGLNPDEIFAQKREAAHRKKSIEDFLSVSAIQPAAHELEIKLVQCSPVDKQFTGYFKESYSVYWKYQTIVHRDPPEKPSVQNFTRFLCDSPLQYQSSNIASHPGYGSFHQLYLLDGKIVAVGVIDILPHCVSSKYFYYDPTYSFLGFGTYSALREIAFVRQLSKIDPDLQWYYMGFYIHNCPKMRYKKNYFPSDLLCPETYQWFPIAQCIPKLDVSKYARFASGDSKIEVPPGDDAPVALSAIPVLVNRTMMPYAVYRAVEQQSSSDELQQVKEYAFLVGDQCANRMLLCL